MPCQIEHRRIDVELPWFLWFQNVDGKRCESKTTRGRYLDGCRSVSDERQTIGSEYEEEYRVERKWGGNKE